MEPYTYNADNGLNGLLRKAPLRGVGTSTNDVVTSALNNNAMDYGLRQYDTTNPVLSQSGVPSVINSNLPPPTENGLFTNFNYGGATGNTGLGAMLGAGLDVGQLGLGIAGYLDRADMNKANKALINQQIADNKDTIEARKARREQINRDWGPKPTAGLGAITPKVGV